MIKTSGKKQEFGTGAHRDTQEGKGRYDLIPTIALKRLAIHYENGANAYGENNWKNGMPLRRFLDSAMRHLQQCLDGKEDEDHAGACLWNVCGFIYIQQAIKDGKLPKELDNLYTENKSEADHIYDLLCEIDESGKNEVVSTEELIDKVLIKNEKDYWEKIRQNVSLFVLENNRLPNKEGDVEEVGLWEWCNTQRKLVNCLSENEKHLLESIPYWGWKFPE